MTVHTLSEARARRARLFNPPNGRNSTELDVVPNDTWNKKKAAVRDQLERRRAEEDFRRRSAVERALATARAADKLLGALQERSHVVAIAKRIVAEEGFEPNPPSLHEIFAVVCRHYDVSRTDFLSFRRTKRPVFARHVAMYLARTLTFRSTPEIGRSLGKKDHTTILNGFKKIERLLSEGNERLAADIAAMKSALGVGS